LLVHESVHSDFWQKTTPANLHHKFNEQEFDLRVQEALDGLKRRYDELQLISLGLIVAEASA
jgi:hypothetical protein